MTSSKVGSTKATSSRNMMTNRMTTMTTAIRENLKGLGYDG